MPSLSTGLITTNQVLKGARRLGTNMPYVVGGVLQSPRVVLHDTTTLTAAMADSATWQASTTTSATPHIISLVGGAIEFASNTYTLDTGPTTGLNSIGNLNIDLDYLYDQLCVKQGGAPKYILAAVPRYDEPMTQQEAEEMGVGYFISLTPSGEFVVNEIVSSQSQVNICELGGWDQITWRVLNGCATCEDMELYNQRSISFCPLSFCIRGVAFILTEINEIGNCCNPMMNYSKCEFEQLRATAISIDSIKYKPQVGARVVNGVTMDPGSIDPGVYTLNEFFGTVQVPTPFAGDTTGTSGTNSSYFNSNTGSDFGDMNGPGSQVWKVSSITFFPNLDASMNCESGVTMQNPSSLEEVKAFVAKLTYNSGVINPCEPTTICGLGWDENEIRLTAREYDLGCCRQPAANQGNYPQIRRFITKENALGARWLGRVNPLYSAQSVISQRVAMGSHSHALHLYADPVPLLKFSIKEKVSVAAGMIDAVADTQANIVIDPESIELMSGSFLGY